ncbi:MAG: response regulator [Planctomycetes bacterium]|nr:response regulator [Planctomycetota bacterium]
MPHVVVVEDDKMNARLFDAILRRRGGFQVTITEDPSEVLRLARSRAADLVVMDVSVPNCRLDGQLVDGLEITRRLKGDPATAGIPVLLATAHAMRGDRERFLETSRADDYLAKPIVDQAGLIARVTELIQRSKDAEAARGAAAAPGGQG